MNQRERILAIVVAGLLLVGGGAFLFNLFFLGPLAAKESSIKAVREDVDRKSKRINEVISQRPKLERWRAESLPGDTDVEEFASTRRLYTNYLRDLVRDHNLTSPTLKIASQKPDAKSSPQLSGKKPVYTKLTFTIDAARGNLRSLVNFLDDFYRSGMLAQIKKLKVSRPTTQTAGQKADDLDIGLTIETLVVNGAEPRESLHYIDRRMVVLDTVAALKRAPTGVALGLWEAGPGGELAPTPLAVPSRVYQDIAAKNIFLPPSASTQTDTPAAVDPTRYVYLTDIVRNDYRTEGFLFDRYNNSKTRLRESAAFNDFSVKDSNNKEVLHGKVLRLDPRDVYFEADKKVYDLHVGHNLEEALREPLSESKLKELKVPLPKK